MRRGFADCRLTGIYWRGSIQYTSKCHVDLGHYARGPPDTTNASDLHRTFVEVDATLLGSAGPPAPGSYRSLASPSHHVSFSFISTIVRSPANRFISYSKHPPWKQLLSHALATNERTSLITKIFSDRGEVGTVMQLSGDDAQGFIVTIAGVSPPISSRQRIS